MIASSFAPAMASEIAQPLLRPCRVTFRLAKAGIWRTYVESRTLATADSKGADKIFPDGLRGLNKNP